MSRKPHPWGIPPWKVNFRPSQQTFTDSADIVIVGGGFSGLSAAAWLRRMAPQKTVLVLESATIGEGASGRTGGLGLADTAAGPLPGLGNVLESYEGILRELHIDSGLSLTGVYELGHSVTATKGSAKDSGNSPIEWSDSGELRVVRLVPGGAVDPSKVLDGLALAAENAGAQIIEHAHVQSIAFSGPPRLHIRHRLRSRILNKEISAGQILLSTNAFSLQLSDLYRNTTPRLTLALATAPLSAAQIKAIGLSSRRPFYTVDLPYLWGRLLESNGIVFGAGLVPLPASFGALNRPTSESSKAAPGDLYRFDVRRSETTAQLRWLKDRIRNLHPALRSVRITHRWGGPILFTEGMRPIFRLHPRSQNVMILAGYNGHGVALSVYLGKWAAEALLGRRTLPSWL